MGRGPADAQSAGPRLCNKTCTIIAGRLALLIVQDFLHDWSKSEPAKV